MQEGAYAARGAMIISEKNEEIAERIMHDIGSRRNRLEMAMACLQKIIMKFYIVSL